MSAVPRPSPAELALVLNEFTLPTLPEFHFPPLPQITDIDLRRTVVTHTSFYGVRRNKHDLYPETRVLDYEKLEHIGDSVLGQCAVAGKSKSRFVCSDK